MTDNCPINKARTALFVSVAANIFLIAFTLGHFSAPGVLHPMGFGDHPMMAGMHDGGPDDGGPRFGHPEQGFMPHPPSFFGPDDLFTPDEMHAEEARVQENFDKIETLREAFATQLEAGPVSKEDVLKHFAAIDQVIDTVKKEAQARAADKISGMSAEERQKFAEDMLNKRGMH